MDKYLNTKGMINIYINIEVKYIDTKYALGLISYSA